MYVPDRSCKGNFGEDEFLELDNKLAPKSMKNENNRYAPLKYYDKNTLGLQLIFFRPGKKVFLSTKITIVYNGSIVMKVNKILI